MAPITDEEWADLVTHELPQQSDPVIKKYLESRAALIAQEQKHRSDSSFRQALSPIAKKACDIVAWIRLEEQMGACTSTPVLDIPKRDREVTKTWQIIRRMPKGALLRAYSHTVADIDHVIQVALSTPGMHISSLSGNLATEEARGKADLSIMFRHKQDHESGPLWSSDYKSGTYIPLTEAADNFPDGGKQGFIEWLKGRCTVSKQDSNSRQIWATSYQCKKIIGDIIYYEPIWRAYLQRLMSTLAEDGISWLELRLASPITYYQKDADLPDPDYDNMLTILREELSTFQTANPSTPFWGLRLIWSATRNLNPRSFIEEADTCIATKIVWPSLIAGFDLAGPEHMGKPLTNLLPELFWLRKQCAAEGIQLPFFFAAGEAFGDGDGVDGNLFDALLLGTRRIGGAVSLGKHPRLVEAVKDKRILVEACPTAAGGMMMHHPLPALLAQGVPCALCYDDTGVVDGQDGDGDGGMTGVFWRVWQAWESMDLAGLGSLAENSVRWAAFEDQDAEGWARDIRAASTGSGVKAARLQQWAVAWERFCLWIVTEYGDAYGDANETAE